MMFAELHNILSRIPLPEARETSEYFCTAENALKVLLNKTDELNWWIEKPDMNMLLEELADLWQVTTDTKKVAKEAYSVYFSLWRGIENCQKYPSLMEAYAVFDSYAARSLKEQKALQETKDVVMISYAREDHEHVNQIEELIKTFGFDVSLTPVGESWPMYGLFKFICILHSSNYPRDTLSEKKRFSIYQHKLIHIDVDGPSTSVEEKYVDESLRIDDTDLSTKLAAKMTRVRKVNVYGDPSRQVDVFVLNKHVDVFEVYRSVSTPFVTIRYLDADIFNDIRNIRSIVRQIYQKDIDRHLLNMFRMSSRDIILQNIIGDIVSDTKPNLVQHIIKLDEYENRVRNEQAIVKTYSRMFFKWAPTLSVYPYAFSVFDTSIPVLINITLSGTPFCFPHESWIKESDFLPRHWNYEASVTENGKDLSVIIPERGNENWPSGEWDIPVVFTKS
eukprot:GILJ01015332.1.p1 GENE.GILJ01015332.1~~GILJ01015332.1.p1  ORF type:complete len:448 (+),score=47.27 GILJ01015332.1:191-1534(+)